MADVGTVIRRVVLAIAAPIVLLGGLEVGARAYGLRPTPPVSIGFGAGDPALDLTTDDPDLLWRLVENHRDSGDSYGFPFSTNSLGFRGKERSATKREGVLRILCLGDSTAFGNVTTYPDELESVLSHRFPGREFEVLNAGVPGYSARQGLAVLKRQIEKLSPDVVTWCFGFNNARVASAGCGDDEVIATRQTLLGVLGATVRRLAFGAWLGRKLAPPEAESAQPGIEPPIRVSPSRFAELTAEAAGIAARHGAKFVAIEQPFGYGRVDRSTVGQLLSDSLARETRVLSEQNAALAARCEAENIAFVPMHRIFLGFTPDELFIGPMPDGDLIHENALGSRLFAEKLVEALLASRIIPEPTTISFGDSPITTPSFTIVDLDSDGNEEIAVATIRDGAVSLAILDPRTSSTRYVPLDLPAPERSCALSFVAFFPGEIVVTRRGEGTTIVALSLQRDGSAGRLTPFSFAGSEHVDWIRVVPVDMLGDGRPEYGVECGPAVPPYYLVLDETGTLLPPIVHLFDTSYGFTMSAGPDPRDPNCESLSTSGVSRGIGCELRFSPRLSPPLAESAHYMIVARPCAAFRARQRDAAPVRVVWRAPGFFIEHPDRTDTAFPWGMVACASDAPRVGLAVVPNANGSKDTLFVAALHAGRLECRRVEASGVTSGS
jgi:lysophospholipase L1-like esterase